MKKENFVLIYQKYRMIIFPVVIALSCLILIVFVMIPQLSKFFKNSKEEANFKAKSDFLDTKVEALESLDEKDLQKKLKDVVTAYPQEKDFITLITLLQKITSGNGFNITSLSFGGDGVSKDSSYGILIEAVGPKSVLARLLNSIETSSRLMRVERIEISSSQSGDMITANLAISALFAPIPGNLGSVDSPLPPISKGEEELIARLAGGQEVPLTAVELSPTGKSNPFE